MALKEKKRTWWNKIVETTLFKFLFITLILIGAGPIFNIILNTSTCTKVAGDANAWIGYFGNLLGTSAAIIALSFTLWQNNKNHNELKRIQINTTLHSKNQDRLNNVCNELYNIFNALNPGNIELAMWKMEQTNEKDFKSSLIRELMSLEVYNADIIEKALLIIHMNSDLGNFRTLASPLTTYADERRGKIEILIEKIKTLGSKEDIKELLYLVEQLRESENYLELLNTIRTIITETRNKIDEDLLS